MTKRINGAAAAALLMMTSLAQAAPRPSAFEKCDSAATDALNEISYQANNIPGKQIDFMDRVKESGASKQEIVIAAIIMLKGSGLILAADEKALAATRQCEKKPVHAMKMMAETIEELGIMESGLNDAIAGVPSRVLPAPHRETVPLPNLTHV